MANPAKYQTLSELTDRILVRIGFVSQDASNQHKLIHDFLRSAQEGLILEHEDMLLKDYVFDDVFVPGESLYDLVPECDPEQVITVGYRDGPNQTWCELKRGIPLQIRDDERRDPYRYEIRYGTTNTAQIEFYPTPAFAKPFGYYYKRNATRFTQNNDRTTIDSELVFLTALAKAERHFGYADSALVSEAEAQKRLYKLRVKTNHNIEIKRGMPRRRRCEESNAMRVTIVKS